jgi:hypothetical protein
MCLAKRNAVLYPYWHDLHDTHIQVHADKQLPLSKQVDNLAKRNQDMEYLMACTLCQSAIAQNDRSNLDIRLTIRSNRSGQYLSGNRVTYAAVPMAYEEQVTVRMSKGMRIGPGGPSAQATWMIGAKPLVARRINRVAL